MSKGYGVDQAIANVPEKFKNDAGLNYDRLKWRRKKGRVDSSTEILLKIRNDKEYLVCLLYTSPSPRDKRQSRMPSSA